MTPQAFTDTFKATRESLHLTQREAGALLDVSAQTISNWECGRASPWRTQRAKVIEQLAGAFTRERIIDRVLA